MTHAWATPSTDGFPDHRAHLRILVCVFANSNKVTLEPTLPSLVCQRIDPTIDARLLVIEITKTPTLGDLVFQYKRSQQPFFSLDYAMLPNRKPYAGLNRALGEARLQNADLVLMLNDTCSVPQGWLELMVNAYRRTGSSMIAAPVMPPKLPTTATRLERSIHKSLIAQHHQQSEQLASDPALKEWGLSVENCAFDMQTIRTLDFRFGDSEGHRPHDFVQRLNHEDYRLRWLPEAYVHKHDTPASLSLVEHYRHSRAKTRYRSHLSQPSLRSRVWDRMQSLICMIAGLLATPFIPGPALLFVASNLGRFRGISMRLMDGESQ